ncbi:MAG: hypothetical protein OXK74_02180 [Gemmatimonadota bacterium]|nr:hypothetical protein [Gemmatimonadota bacterium]
MSGDDHIDRFFLMDAEGVHAGEIHRTESGAVAAAEAHPGKVAVQRRSYFLNDMADKVVWMPDGCDDWPPDE